MVSSSFMWFCLGLLIIVLFPGIFVVWGAQPETTDPAANAERRRLYFAGVTLIGLGLILCLSMGMLFFAGEGNRDAAEDIFEACKTGIPPIVTLVVGYYFGQAGAPGGSTNQAPSSQDPSTK